MGCTGWVGAVVGMVGAVVGVVAADEGWVVGGVVGCVVGLVGAVVGCVVGVVATGVLAEVPGTPLFTLTVHPTNRTAISSQLVKIVNSFLLFIIFLFLFRWSKYNIKKEKGKAPKPFMPRHPP